jgi:hypothetical protein
MDKCKPCIKLIFRHVVTTNSDLNDKIISCLVPVILREEEPSDLLIQLFKDKTEGEEMEVKYLTHFNDNCFDK